MRITTSVFIICYLLILSNRHCEAQINDTKTFNTFTFFYIDNSEGYNSTAMNSALNDEVSQEFTKRLNGVADKPDNYFYLIGSDGENFKQSNSAKSLLGSDWLRKYLAKTSREADYAKERQALRESFVSSPIRIKKEVDVYIFLSGYAMSQFSKKLDEFPTPLFFPKEMVVYVNNKDVFFNIYIYTNRDVVDFLTIDKIKGYFNFCNANLNINAYDIEVLPF